MNKRNIIVIIIIIVALYGCLCAFCGFYHLFQTQQCSMELNIATLYIKNGNDEKAREQMNETRECLDQQQDSWSYKLIDWNTDMIDKMMGVS